MWTTVRQPCSWNGGRSHPSAATDGDAGHEAGSQPCWRRNSLPRSLNRCETGPIVSRSEMSQMSNQETTAQNALGSEPAGSLQVCWSWSARRSCRTEHHLRPQAEESMQRPDSPVRIVGGHLKATGWDPRVPVQHLSNFILLRFSFRSMFFIWLDVNSGFWGQTRDKVQSLPTFVLFKPRDTNIPTETWHCFR